MRCELLMLSLMVCLGCEQTIVRNGGPSGRGGGTDLPWDSGAHSADAGVLPTSGGHSDRHSSFDAEAHAPPGAEQCNGVDDDDDGLVDEEDAYGCTDYYLDSDGDGYGIGAPLCLCQPGAFHTATQGGDCLDDSPYIHPGAEENCYNLVDDDCDGEAQIPECEGKECGPDGCGGECGVCPDNHFCNQDLKCESSCDPQCAGKECGPDGCGSACGVCDGPQEECSNGLCICLPHCVGKDCGPDGCAGTCGQCAPAQYECVNGLCTCTPACGGKECGSDGCGGSCGSCPSPYQCQAGSCACVPGSGCNPVNDGDTISIRSSKWNLYCAAESSGQHVVHCDKASPAPWGLYTVHKTGGSGVVNSGDTVSFRSTAWNKYCAAEEYEHHEMH